MSDVNWQDRIDEHLTWCLRCQKNQQCPQRVVMEAYKRDPEGYAAYDRVSTADPWPDPFAGMTEAQIDGWINSDKTLDEWLSE